MNTLKNKLCAIIIFTSILSFAEPSGDRPNESHAWSVHDTNRPDPIKVEVHPGQAPSDAYILFDGTEESVKKNWRDKTGAETKWTVNDGQFICTPGSGSVRTAQDFADFQLHIEWKTPLDDLEGWGNSGVIIFGQYEIQILDSSNVKPSRSPWKPANYADGQAGAVYGQNPPIVQPCRKPGQWQSFDIIFHPPTWQEERLVDPGSITVFFNGVLVQDSFPFQGTTQWCRRPGKHSKKRCGPIFLQDHGHPVPFRNIWVRDIPSRYADTVNGSLGLKYADVAALRAKLAKESFQFAKEATDCAEKFIRLWESFCYEPNRDVLSEINKVEEECIKAIAAGTGGFQEPRKFHAFIRFVSMLERGDWIKKDSPIREALNKQKLPPKPKAPNMRDF